MTPQTGPIAEFAKRMEAEITRLTNLLADADRLITELRAENHSLRTLVTAFRSERDE